MANHRKKPIDPSKPLPNPKHEIIAQELAKGKTQIEAYSKAFPNTKRESVAGFACTSIATHGINDRALKLLESVGLSEVKLASTLNKHIDSETAQISLDATKTGFKLLGYGSEQKIAESSYNPTQINIIVRSNSIEPIDIKEDTANGN